MLKITGKQYCIKKIKTTVFDVLIRLPHARYRNLYDSELGGGVRGW